MLYIDRHSGVISQSLTERHIFHVIIKRHSVNDTVFSINDPRQGDGDCGKSFELVLMANKKLVDMFDDPRQQRLRMLQRQFQLFFHHQLAAQIAQRQVDFPRLMRNDK